MGETLHRVWVLVSSGVCVWLLNDPSRWRLGRLCARALSAVPGHWRVTGCATRGSASGSADERLRMIPVARVIRECRMQFPRHYVAPHIHIVGIATFVDTVETSPNRIACETASSERTRAHVGPLASLLPGNRTQEAHSRACGPAISHVNRLIRAWAL